MIRRELDGFDWLIAQDDHGIFAGVCAQHVGNSDFVRPEPMDSVVSGTRMHDSGWPLHDDNPTLDPGGRPMNVFDRPASIGLVVWGESVERAAAADAYGGLLVSLHAMRITHDLIGHETPAGIAASEKFIADQSQKQYHLRRKLGFALMPLRYGLAEPGASAREDQLAYNFRWLQACDQFSLAVLCSSVPPMPNRHVSGAPGGDSLHLQLDRPEPLVLTVSPWPFDTDRIAWQAPARRLASRTWPDNATFQAAYRDAERATLEVEVRKA